MANAGAAATLAVLQGGEMTQWRKSSHPMQ
jgi:hypothetical protein